MACCAVIYEPLPGDPSSGKILWSTQAPLAALQRETRPWIATPTFDPEFDRTHKVEGGLLVQTHQWVLSEGGRRLHVIPLDD